MHKKEILSWQISGPPQNQPLKDLQSQRIGIIFALAKYNLLAVEML